MLNKKIAVIAPDLESFGGGTQCAISCIEALNDAKIVPDVYSRTGRINIVNKKFGRSLNYNFKKIIFTKRFALYFGLVKNINMLFKEYDYVFDFTNSFPFNKNKGRYFMYVLFPEFVPWKRGKYNLGIWKLYRFPEYLINLVKFRIVDYKDIKIVCDSEFTKENAKRMFDGNYKVIYPPVQIKEFKDKVEGRSKKGIASTGSFSIEKNQMLQVEIAKEIPEIEFSICGKSKRMPSYFKKVKNEAKKLTNVRLFPNISFEKLKEKLLKSLIFIHTSKNEPFGISTVEAIAAGCIPVVHNSGGQREVVPFKELRFKDKEEAVKIIKEILKWNEKKRQDYRKKLQKHIEKFDEKIFKDKIIDILKSKN